MKHSLRKEVEILIHTSAPSGVKDDSRYRKQAAAYLDFDPQNVISVFSGQQHSPARPIRLTKTEGCKATQVKEASPCHRDPPHQPTREETPDHQYDGPEATSTFSESVSPHLTTSLSHSDEHAPPLLINRTKRPSAGLSIPPSSVKSTPHREEEARRQASCRSEPQRTSIDLSGCHLELEEPSIRFEPRTCDDDAWRTPPSVITNFQPSAKLSSYKESLLPSAKRLSQRSRPRSRPYKRRQLQQAELKATFTIDGDRGEEGRDREQETPSPLLVAPTSVNDYSATSLPHEQAPITRPLGLRTHQASEIYPPPPPTTVISFSNGYPSQITPTLAMLASIIDLSKRFQPLHSTRPLQPLERGYWLIDTSSWSTHLQDNFWAFLQDLISDGRAGWGVWCTKAGDGKDGSTGDEEGRCSAGRRVKECNVIRVYCWGEVVGHVYLVIFLASNRKIKGTGARWIGSGGDVVVQMA
ncbi:MAG: hypothetical protein M1835_007572 [Candelina submexicana]|nr:MAG: hypothetical protein M1835_007572 [Candelina submexicana]